MGKSGGRTPSPRASRTSNYATSSRSTIAEGEGLLYWARRRLVQVSETAARTAREGEVPGRARHDLRQRLFASRRWNVVYRGDSTTTRWGDFKALPAPQRRPRAHVPSIAGDLPRVQHVDRRGGSGRKDLWFVGTEFGIFLLEGRRQAWVQLKGGPADHPRGTSRSRSARRSRDRDVRRGSTCSTTTRRCARQDLRTSSRPP